MKKVPGSKTASGVIQWLINQIPPHKWLIEAFGGMGTLTRTIQAADKQTIVEVDEATAFELKDETKAEIIQGDAIRYIQAHMDSPKASESLIYADPPYVHAARGQTRLYRYEFSDEDHAKLCDVLRNWPGKVILSGYDNRIYGELLWDWRTSEFLTMTRGGVRKEMLWMNFPEPDRLHDYRYLGADRTDRQRIRRKIERVKAKLAELPVLERHAIIDELSNRAFPGTKTSLA